MNIADMLIDDTPARRRVLMKILCSRFASHPERHPAIPWETVESRLKKRPARIRSLLAMEDSGGEPDVVGSDPISGEFHFVDCSAETPKGRVSLCYDHDGWISRKELRPTGNAVDSAAAIGAELLDEKQYLEFQKLGEFDRKTSSWLKTPPELRKLGGALFGDRRYGRVFIYHNGAQSYYATRGFRCLLRV